MNSYTARDDKSEYIYHHGVLGMKWGMRKQKVSSGRTRSQASSTHNSSANAKNTASHGRNKVSSSLKKGAGKVFYKTLPKNKTQMAGSLFVSGLALAGAAYLVKHA